MSAYREQGERTVEGGVPVVTQAREPAPESRLVWVAVAVLAIEAGIGHWVDFSAHWLATVGALDVVLFALARIAHLTDMKDEKIAAEVRRRKQLAKTLFVVLDRWPSGSPRKSAREWLLESNEQELTPVQAETLFEVVSGWARR